MTAASWEPPQYGVALACRGHGRTACAETRAATLWLDLLLFDGARSALSLPGRSQGPLPTADALGWRWGPIVIVCTRHVVTVTVTPSHTQPHKVTLLTRRRSKTTRIQRRSSLVLAQRCGRELLARYCTGLRQGWADARAARAPRDRYRRCPYLAGTRRATPAVFFEIRALPRPVQICTLSNGTWREV